MNDEQRLAEFQDLVIGMVESLAEHYKADHPKEYKSVKNFAQGIVEGVRKIELVETDEEE